MELFFQFQPLVVAVDDAVFVFGARFACNINKRKFSLASLFLCKSLQTLLKTDSQALYSCIYINREHKVSVLFRRSAKHACIYSREPPCCPSHALSESERLNERSLFYLSLKCIYIIYQGNAGCVPPGRSHAAFCVAHLTCPASGGCKAPISKPPALHMLCGTENNVGA